MRVATQETIVEPYLLTGQASPALNKQKPKNRAMLQARKRKEENQRRK
jgi:hypothetical protein